MRQSEIFYETSVADSLEEAMQQETKIVQRLQERSKNRVIIRPKRSVWKDAVILAVVLMLTVSVMLFLNVFLRQYFPKWGVILVLTAVLLFSVVSQMRRFLLMLITLYQKYAPETVRAACLYEPCCSEYMRRSILKYGVPKGVAKGIGRLTRCRYTNGGIDEP